MDAPDPLADRPSMPGYGLAASEDGEGLLPWSWAEQRLTEARNYWVSTADERGRPHSMPVWAVWLDGALFFSTGRRTRKGRNLLGRPECVVTPESGAEAVILEGEAEEVADAAVVEAVARAYETKYPMGFPPDEPLFRVRPRRVFGLIETPARFTRTATRWRFEGA